MPKPKLHTIEGVELFRTGKWNGKTFTEDDLDDIIDAFGKQGFLPKVKIDTGGGRPAHADGGPAYGVIASIKRVGSTLIGTLAQIPDTIFEMLQRGAFDERSVEIHRNIERDGVKLPLVLGAVELLGATIPAVSDLEPLTETIEKIGLSSTEASSPEIITLSIEDENMPESYAGKSFGSVVRAARKKNGMSLSALAKATSISEGVLSAFEDGEKHPSKARMGKIFGALNIPSERMADFPPPGAGDDDDKGGDKDKEKAKQKQKMTQDLLDERTEEVEELREDLAAARATRSGEGSKVDALSQELAKIKEERRQEKIERLVSDCRVPAVRDHVRNFALVFTSKAAEGQKLTFSVGDEDTVTLSGFAAAQKFVEDLNAAAESAGLFTQITPANRTGDREDMVVDSPDEASLKLSQEIEKVQAEKPDLDYNAAYAVVKVKFPELVKEYGRGV